MRQRRLALRFLMVGSLVGLTAMGFGPGSLAAQGGFACEDRPGRVDWDGDAGTSAWNDPVNWSSDVLPGAGGHVCIAMPGLSVVLDTGVASIASIEVAPASGLILAGSATLDIAGPEPSTLATLGVYGGTLSGAGTRTVTGSAVLDAGTLSGNGRTVIGPGGRLVIGSGVGGTLAINGGHVLALEAGASGVWGPGPHDIALDAPSRLENAGGLDITNDRSLRGSGTLANTGTLRKLSHGTTSLVLLLDNDGLLTIDAGLLDAGGGDGGLGSDGRVEIVERSRLRLRDGVTTLGAAADVSGGGEIEVAANATLTVPASATWDIATTYLTGGALTLEGERTLATLGVYGGTLSGAGTRTVTGSAVLDAGTLSGNGRTVIGPGGRLVIGSGVGGTLAINGGHVLALEAGASGVWGPGPHDIALDAPSRLENAGGLDITNDRSLRGSGTLANTGTLRKLSHGTTSLVLAPADGALLANDGTIDVIAGTLEFAGVGLENRGVLYVATDAAESGMLRATAFRQTPEGSLRIGLAGPTPAARAGVISLTTTGAELAGGLSLVVDPSFIGSADQRLPFLMAPAVPVGSLTLTDPAPPGDAASVSVEMGVEGVGLVIQGGES